MVTATAGSTTRSTAGSRATTRDAGTVQTAGWWSEFRDRHLSGIFSPKSRELSINEIGSKWEGSAPGEAGRRK